MRASRFFFTDTAHLWLVAGVPGQSDFVAIVVQLDYGGYLITYTGKIKLPAGTITTPAIGPFAAPVTLTPHDALVTYSSTGTNFGPFTSTTLQSPAGP